MVELLIRLEELYNLLSMEISDDEKDLVILAIEALELEVDELQWQESLDPSKIITGRILA